MSSSLLLTIKMGNDAIQSAEDVADALRSMARMLEAEGVERDAGGIIRDVNGNTIGSWAVAA